MGKFAVKSMKDGFHYVTIIYEASNIEVFDTKRKADKLKDALNRAFKEVVAPKPFSGKRSRRKGHSFERDVAIALRGLYPKAKRQLEYQEDECVGVDIANAGPFKIQCKKLKKYAPIKYIEEVKCDRTLGDIPILITAGDGEEAMTVIPFEEFLRLVKASRGYS